MRSVKANFRDGDKEYEYFVPGGDDPQVGDYLITTMESSSQYLGVAKVMSVQAMASSKANTEYLVLLSGERLKERTVERAKNAADRQAKAAALEKLKSLMDGEMLIALAESRASTNPEIDRLLKVLKGS